MPTINKNKIETRYVPLTRYNNDDSLRRYYNNVRWKKLSKYFLANNPLCKDCAINGRSVAATEAHHSIVWSWFDDETDRWKCLLCYDILVPLCRQCHLERHKHLYRPLNFKETAEYSYIHNM